jgi:dUTP pyrophosphatase
MKPTPTLKTTSDNISHPSMPGDVGYNLKVSEEIVSLPAGKLVSIKTDVRVEIPEGYWGLILPRSSANMSGILIFSGVIDTGYRGELFVLALNLGSSARLLTKGQSLAQMVFFPSSVFDLERVEDLSDSHRGNNGFGSTGR